MSQANIDLVLDVGCDFSSTIYIVDGSGTPINWYGCSATMMIRASATSPTALISISTTASASGSIVLDVSGGSGAVQINIARTAITTAVGAIGTGVYELDVTDTSGAVTSILKGYVVFSPQVIH